MKWLFRLGQDLNRALARPAVRRLLGALVLFWLLDRAVYFLTETQWQQAAGFGTTWQIRVVAQLLLFGIAIGSTLLLSPFLKPLWNLPSQAPQLPSSYAWAQRRLHLLMHFDRRLVALLILGSALSSGWMAASHWPQWLLFLHGEKWGYQAPLWPRDVSWWLFQLSFWQLLLDVFGRAASVVFFCGLLLLLSRGAGRFFSRQPALPPQALQALALLGMALLLVRAAHFALMPFSEMTSSVLDAAQWNGRRPAWWLSAFLQAWPLALLLFFLVKRALPKHLFVLSLATAFLAPPFLLWAFSRLGSLIDNNDAFLTARRAATRQAWNLDSVKIEQWQPLNARRALPQDTDWLKHLRFDEKRDIIENRGAILSLRPLIWRLLWVWRRRDLSLLHGPENFTSRQTLETQRAALAPFLLPGNPARRVEIEGQVFHLQELMVATDAFPGSNAETMEVNGQTQSINSAYAAVLMVQNVPNGNIKFYALQAAPDALTCAWQKALPDLILPYAALPKMLPNRRRYPAELLKRQAHQLSEVMDADWHMARQRGASGWLEIQEPIYATLPSGKKSSFMAQLALCSDTNGQTLAALLQVCCEYDKFGQLSLLRFESGTSSLASLNSGLIGPDILAERLEAALPLEADLPQETTGVFSAKPQKVGPQWVAGTVVPVAIQNQVWLWQPIFREQKATKSLTGIALTNAAWADGPVGVGQSVQATQTDWKRLEQVWQNDDLQQAQSLRSRLRALLEPNKVQKEAEAARLIDLAAKLHQAAEKTEKTDPPAAQWLRQQQGQTLQELRRLMPLSAEKP